MKTIGEEIFAKDASGNLVSKVGTIFLRTPGLVTLRGIHAMQRVAWLDEVNRMRAAEGLSPLTPEEEDEELSQSVDLIFTDAEVLIRPDPDHMDLALRADGELQKLVSKRKIRFLNTHSAKVRNALTECGENWRMARAPASQDDMRHQIDGSRVSVEGCKRIYYYNHTTGTRYLTAAGCAGFESLADDELRRQVKEAVTLLSRRNRFGMPELDLFPVTTPIEIKKTLKALDPDALTNEQLRKAIKDCYQAWRMSIPVELREESVENFEWRNEMSRTLSNGPNDTAVDERMLIQGISPEFYRQIEWLPGARIDKGQLIFDSIWDEYARTQDPDLAQFCDSRVRNIVFNFMRLFSDIEHINIGRIANSLARTHVAGHYRRGNVYLVQFKVSDDPQPKVLIIRFLKWGVAEHLDEGKDLLQSMIEANEYADYILDRRLMCQQLGMRLPSRVGYGHFTEQYHGRNQYNGITIRTAYNVRSYIHGTASDKIPRAKFRNPVYALKFAELMGEAAALDMIVGRKSTGSEEFLFDRLYEVIQHGDDGFPARVLITNHEGSFVDYQSDYLSMAPAYAIVVNSRREFLPDVNQFAEAYVGAFEKRLREVQAEYRSRRVAFDELFMHRPFDAGGSGAFRWAKALERLDKCDPARVADALRRAIES